MAYQVGQDANPPILGAELRTGVGQLQELTVTVPTAYYDGLASVPGYIYADGFGGKVEDVARTATTITLTAKSQAGDAMVNYARLNPESNAQTVRAWLSGLVATANGQTSFDGNDTILSSAPITTGLAVGAFFDTLVQLAGNYGLEMIHTSTAAGDVYRFVHPSAVASDDVPACLSLTVHGDKPQYDYAGITKTAPITQRDTAVASAARAVDYNDIKYTSQGHPYLQGTWHPGQIAALSFGYVEYYSYTMSSHSSGQLRDSYGNIIPSSLSETTYEAKRTEGEYYPRLRLNPVFIHTRTTEHHETSSGSDPVNTSEDITEEISEQWPHTEHREEFGSEYYYMPIEGGGSFWVSSSGRTVEDYKPRSDMILAPTDFPWMFIAKEIVDITETVATESGEGYTSKTIRRTPVFSEPRFSANFNDTYHPSTIDPNPPADISLEKHSESFFDPTANPSEHSNDIQSMVANIQYQLGTKTQKIALRPSHRLGILTARWLDGTKMRYYTVNDEFDLSTLGTGTVACTLISASDKSFTTLTGNEPPGEGYVLSGTVWSSKAIAAASLPYVMRQQAHSVQVSFAVPFVALSMSNAIALVGTTQHVGGHAVHITSISCDYKDEQSAFSGYVVAA